MDAILAAARALADALKESPLYQSYRSSRVRLEQQPDVAAQLRQFKQMQAGLSARPDMDFDEEKAVSHRYAELTRHPAAAAFLTHERALLDVYGQLIDLIDDAWEIDLFEG